MRIMTEAEFNAVVKNRGGKHQRWNWSEILDGQRRELSVKDDWNGVKYAGAQIRSECKKRNITAIVSGGNPGDEFVIVQAILATPVAPVVAEPLPPAPTAKQRKAAKRNAGKRK